MNVPLITALIGLRYKLLWAKTRSRNGRIALFLVGYLLLAVIIALLAAGGLAAGIVAIRSGQAERIVRIALLTLFLQAVLAANILGFGLSDIFSDTELRRYPLNALDRGIARHVIGIVDPFWVLFFALEFGLATGIAAMDAGSFWLGTIAILLLFVSNYLLANVVALFVERLMKSRGGPAVLVVFILALAIGPSAARTFLSSHPAVTGEIFARLQFTPPFGAAAAIIHPDLTGVYGLLTIAVWIVGLALVLVWIEKRPSQRQAAVTSGIRWNSPFDRAGALFGPELGPFVSYWLRFYVRNSRTRIMALIALPLFGFITVRTAERLGPNGLFVAALGTFPIMTFMWTSRIAVNQFGYAGGAFRRYFLLPVDPPAVLRAASYTSLTLGAAMLSVVLLAWTVLAPLPLDPRMLVMLACSSIGGLLLFNAAGIWITILNPRRGKYNANFGNDLSLGGNILVIGGVIAAFWLPTLLYHTWPAAVSPDSWWMLLPVPAAAAVLYAVSLRAAGPVFTARREQILGVIETKV